MGLEDKLRRQLSALGLKPELFVLMRLDQPFPATAAAPGEGPFDKGIELVTDGQTGFEGKRAVIRESTFVVEIIYLRSDKRRRRCKLGAVMLWPECEASVVSQAVGHYLATHRGTLEPTVLPERLAS